MTFIKKHLGVCVLFLLFTLGATKAQAQFGVYFTNNVIPAEQKDGGTTEPALQAYFGYNQGSYDILEGSNYFSFGSNPSSIDIQFLNYSGYYWYYGNQGVGAYITIKVFDFSDQIIYDETQYIGPYSFSSPGGAGVAIFTGVPTSGYIEITTSSSN